MSRSNSSKLLLVEDEAIIALDEQRMLEGYGYRVVVAHSGEKAVKIVRDNDTIDLVLMDIDLGSGIDGTEAARQILDIRELPILFLTSHSEEEMVDKVKGITGYGYVIKSSGEFVLLEMVEMARRLFQKQIEARESSDLYRSITSLTGEIIVRHDREGRWLFVNDTGKREWGLTDDLPTDTTYLDFVHPEDKDEALQARRQMENNHTSVSSVINRQWTIHGWRTYQWNSAPLFDRGGNYAGFQATGRDVTERERAVEQFRENEQKYRWLAENASDMVAVMNPEFVPEYVSPSVEEITGYSQEELRKQGALQLVHVEDVAKLREYFERDMANGLTETTWEYRFLTKAGQVIWAESHVRFVRDEQGRVSRLVFNARDITERKEAAFRLEEKQQEVEQALERERLLRREVHHRIKNDMNLVNSMLSLQIRETTNPDAQASLHKAADRVMVMSEVYEQLYSSAEFEEVNAKQLVERLGSNYNTGLVLNRETLHIVCDEFSLPTRVGVSLGIILNELLTNAFKYGNDASQEQPVRAEVRLVDQTRIRVTVRDTGSGFPEDVLHGQDHGFGLTAVSALTEQHNGQLKIRNDNGGVVEVTLPLQ